MSNELDKEYGIGVFVNGEIVAWFPKWTEETREWCSENYFGQWLIWKATTPKMLKKLKDKERSC